MSSPEIETANLNNINNKIQIIKIKLNLIGAIDGSLNYNYFINTENTQRSSSSALHTQLYIPVGLTFNEFSSELKKPFNNKQNQEIFLDINKLNKYLEKFRKKITFNRLSESKKTKPDNLSSFSKLETDLKELNKKQEISEIDLEAYQRILHTKANELSANKKKKFEEMISKFQTDISKNNISIQKLKEAINKEKNLETKLETKLNSREKLNLTTKEIQEYIKKNRGKQAIRGALFSAAENLKDNNQKIAQTHLQPNILNILTNIFFSPKSTIYLKGHPFIIENIEDSNEKKIKFLNEVTNTKISNNPLDYQYSFYQLEDDYIEEQVNNYKDYHPNLTDDQITGLKGRIKKDISRNPSRINNYAEDLIKNTLNKKFRDKGIVFEYSPYRGIIIKNLTKIQKAHYQKIRGITKVIFTIKIKDGETNLFKKIQKKCLSKKSQINKKLLEEIKKSKTLYSSDYKKYAFVKFVNKNLGHSDIPIPTYENLSVENPFAAKISSSTKKGGRVIKAKKKRTKKLKLKKKGNIKY